MKPKALSFQLVENDNGVPRIVWTGESNYSAGTLLREAEDPNAGSRKAEQLDKAREYLTKTLAGASARVRSRKARRTPTYQAGRSGARKRPWALGPGRKKALENGRGSFPRVLSPKTHT